MNFARDVVAAAPPPEARDRRAGARRHPPRVALRRGGRAGRALHAHLDAQGARRGDVVLTLLGNRPEWVLAMVACFRGYAVLPCTEQLRPKDLRLRLGGPGRSW